MKTRDIPDHSLREALDHSGGRPANDASLDGVRIVAMFMVILIHISSKGFQTMGPHWWAVNAFESVSRTSVPMFFMLTGALLLPRDHSVGSLVKRIGRVALPLFVWSLLYLTWYKEVGMERHDWIPLIIDGPVVGHLWYLYSLIAAYCFLPVIAGFYVTARPRAMAFVLVVWFFASSVLPTVHDLAGRGFIGINWSFFYIYPLYMVVGAVIGNRLRVTQAVLTLSIFAWTASLFATAWLTWANSVGSPKMNESFYEYYSPAVFIGAIAAFICIRRMTAAAVDTRIFSADLIGSIGRLMFGVYLLHPMVIWTFERYGYDYQTITPWLSIPLLGVSVFIICSVIVYLLRKVPVVRTLTP